jgi:predicted component of type VI protein secretion system
MTTLVLQCIALNDQPMSRPLIGRFDERGGTLGRSDDVTLTLPDPDRRISRLQAKVLHRDGQYWIENVSDISPVLHNGHPIGQGMQVVLRDGDELRISDYSLQCAFDDGPESDSILRGRTEAGASLPAAAHQTPAVLAPRPADTDLQSRQVAMTAGMGAILGKVFERLDPEKLEGLLGKRTFLERLRPTRRTARLWRLYLQQYDALRSQAQQDFQRAIGETFRAAYEAQVPNSNAESDETVRPDKMLQDIATLAMPPQGAKHNV